MRTIDLFGSIALLLALPGCFGGADAPVLSASSYDYDRCTDSSCEVDYRQLAAGTTATIAIRLTPGAVGIASVNSSSTIVAAFVAQPVVDDILHVDVTAGEPGTSTLTLVDQHGHLAGQVDVHVAAASVLQPRVPSLGTDGSLGLLVDQVATIDVVPMDAQGNSLVGNVPIAISGANTVAPTALGRYAIRLGDRGAATLTGAISGGPSFTLPLRGDSLADLVVLLGKASPIDPATNGGADFFVTATPQDVLGTVYGPTCTWQVAPTSVTATHVYETTLGWPDGDGTLFTLPAGLDHATATCQIGALSTTVDLQR